MTTQPNQPSLNPWDYKPWWCQPWSIALSGTGIIAGSWWLLHSRWITGLVSLPVLAWMGFFLLVWPRWMRQILQEHYDTQGRSPNE